MKAKFLVSAQFALLVLLLFAKGSKMTTNSVVDQFPPFLYVSGALTLFLAYRALRPSLRVSPIPMVGAPLIVHGIYKWLRHPMYLAVLLFGAGLAIRSFSYLSFGLWIILAAVLVAKAKYEDALLRNIHPNALAYQQNVRGILLTKKEK